MKRFSETDKWKDEWFSSLAPVEKLVFLFLIDSCDNAGFFELNTRLNSYLIGISEVEYLGAIKGLNRGLLGAKNEKVYWIKKFLFHQKNLPLNSENNAHKQIISILQEKIPLFDDVSLFVKLGANQGLFSPIGKGKGKGSVKVGSEEKISFDEFWKQYPVKQGKAKCEPKWNALTVLDQQKIIDILPLFIAHKPFPEYIHPFPETFFNQKRWNDSFEPAKVDQPSLLSKFKNQEVISHEDFYGTNR